jgi:hypothetical protein
MGSLKAVAFDLGHTLMDERRDGHLPIEVRPVHLMPGVSEVLPQLALPLAVWAKPDRTFFEHALARCGLVKDAVLFVGNQLNTDIAGAEAFGIRTVWLSGPAYRSDDDTPCQARPTFTIGVLGELPPLLEGLRGS